MDNEKLIILVQSNSELFDKFHPNYKLCARKRAIWADIARELNSTHEQCSRRWLSLRERYSKEVRRLNAPSGSGASAEKVWPLMDSLHFLKQHIIPRACRTSRNILVPLAASTLASPEYPSPSQSPPVLPHSPPMIQLPSPSPSPPLQQHGSQSLFSFPSTPSPASQAPTAGQGKKRKGSKPNNRDVDEDVLFGEVAVAMLKKLIKEKAYAANEVREENAAVHGFGQMIVSCICKMSMPKQTIAMERVTVLVMGMLREPDE